MKKILIVTFCIACLLVGFQIVKFQSALTQERNPLPIILSIYQLDWTNKEFVQFEENEQFRRFVSANTGENRYNPVKVELEKMGWTFKEQMGSGLIFIKADKTVVVETRQFTRHYFLWKIPKELS